MDNLCNILFLCYNSMKLVNCIHCHGKNNLRQFLYLCHGLGSCTGSCTTALPAPESQTEPGTAQPWVPVRSQVLLLLDSSLLGGGTCPPLAAMCSSSQSLPFLKTSSMYLLPSSPGMPASKHKQHTPTELPFQLAAYEAPGSCEIISVA